MIVTTLAKRLAVVVAALTLTACAVPTPPRYDYSNLRESRPKSILVLPPVNNSPDVSATLSVLAQSTLPLAESGYYVLPVTLVEETFKQNGMTAPSDIHQIPLPKLREIFGADAALYINVTRYGTSYALITSETRVTLDGTLVDLRTGKQLWKGAATASSAEGNGGGNSLAELLVRALLTQIVETVSSRGHQIAGIASYRLLGAGRPNGLLYGPRSPNYQKDALGAP